MVFAISLAIIARPSSIVDCTLFWGGGCCNFLQRKRRDQRAEVKLTLYAIGCLPSLPCRHWVKPANSVQRGKSQLGDWLPQKRIETRKKCILLQGRLKALAEWAGLPSPINYTMYAFYSFIHSFIRCVIQHKIQPLCP